MKRKDDRQVHRQDISSDSEEWAQQPEDEITKKNAVIGHIKKNVWTSNNQIYQLPNKTLIVIRFGSNKSEVEKQERTALCSHP